VFNFIQFVKKNLITAAENIRVSYVYYSLDESTKKQVINREKEIEKISQRDQIPDEQKTIRILLEIIQNPNAWT